MYIPEQFRFNAEFIRRFLELNIPERERSQVVRDLFRQLIQIEEGESDDFSSLKKFCFHEDDRLRVDDERLFTFIDTIRKHRQFLQEIIS
ncbi:MAG: hypothetical protein A2V81_03555 [Candidatus Abawacabacteria bacterium RBG_16_42_10]|uniref:Uncharacterized protein n=1 Tax=Candidatus Abawacabacteria bacterium RBG_16_42_10 TaxID=1817814 RepID=A0A1F4XJY1_9BACT|nr:MAG: hypothetical protein A2V81_03555 [Candidatus Abawacabacteria bacterium RBG_16_42_10]